MEAKRKITHYDEILEHLGSMSIGMRFSAIRIRDQKPFRAFIEDNNTVFVFAPHCSKRGWRYTIHSFAIHYHVLILSEQDKTSSWHKRLKRAVACLENSGLWKNIKEVYTNILSSNMSWDDRERMNSLYWEYCSPSGKHSDEEIRNAFAAYINKYPFAFFEAEDGSLQIDNDYIWEISYCNLKSMYFGKNFNKEYKERIRKAIAERKDLTIPRVVVRYDVSFEYKADKGLAWYSEEYRNCGNGHYYLALDHNTALFYEDD